MRHLLYAPQPTDLRPPRRAAPVADLAELPDLSEVEELDSYGQEERELLFAAWCSEVDADDPPF